MYVFFNFLERQLKNISPSATPATQRPTAAPPATQRPTAAPPATQGFLPRPPATRGLLTAIVPTPPGQLIRASEILVMYE